MSAENRRGKAIAPPKSQAYESLSPYCNQGDNLNPNNSSPGNGRVARCTTGVERNPPEKQQDDDCNPQASSDDERNPSTKQDGEDLTSPINKEREEQIWYLAPLTPVDSVNFVHYRSTPDRFQQTVQEGTVQQYDD